MVNNDGCGTLTSTEHPTVDMGLVRTSPSDIRLTKELLHTHNGDNINMYFYITCVTVSHNFLSD